MEIARSAKLYQERRQPQFNTTRRAPGPRYAQGVGLFHSFRLQPPYPPATAKLAQDQQPPDAGATTPWPHGVSEAEIS